ncbi:MAG: helix-turn-helix domain-containing protein [Runella sp.]
MQFEAYSKYLIFAIMNDIYEKIKAIRLAKKLTQAEVANNVGMTQGNYGRLEKGLIQVTIERLEQLADVFEMSVGNIINYELNPSENTFAQDKEYYINEVKRLEKQVAKLKKQLEEEEEMFDDNSTKHSEEREKLKRQIQQLKRENKDLNERLAEKDSLLNERKETIETLRSTLNGLLRLTNPQTDQSQ